MSHASKFLFRAWLTRLLGAFFLLLAPAFAQAEQAFDEAAFKAAQQQGKTILVEVHADWCPACRKQEAILKELSVKPPYAGIVRFRVNYDKPGNALKLLKANSQATLVLFKGSQEIGRSAFDTKAQDIESLLKKAG